MDYVEERLTQDISLAEAAKTIRISEYHLKRTFSFIAGFSLVEYIKNRRLALANAELIKGKSVTEILVQSITEQQKTEMHKLGDLYPKQVINASYNFGEG